MQQNSNRTLSTHWQNLEVVIRKCQLRGVTKIYSVSWIVVFIRGQLCELHCAVQEIGFEVQPTLAERREIFAEGLNSARRNLAPIFGE